MAHWLNPDPPDVYTIEQALVDFGFYHEFSQVARMFAELENRGNYGYPGAVLDQPDSYWRDMATMRWLELWHKHVKNIPRFEQVSVFKTRTVHGVMKNGDD